MLLSCAFLYDIFWVFVSKKVFNESVMIVVSRELHFDLHCHRLEEDHLSTTLLSY